LSVYGSVGYLAACWAEKLADQTVVSSVGYSVVA
jgi:hypothetical protein